MSFTTPRALLAVLTLSLLTACGAAETEADDVAVRTEASAVPVSDDGADDDTDAGDEGQDDPGTDDGAGGQDEPGDADADAAARCDGREDEAFIEVLTPTAGDTVPASFEVTGCGNTFEATYVWRLVQDGAVIDGGFGTMSCGSGCVGTFTFTVATDVTGEVVLVVFEESAEDGSEQHVVELPLVVT